VDDLIAVSAAAAETPAANNTAWIDVLANDTDVDGDELRILGVSQPQHGVLTIVDGKLLYQAGLDYAGADQFTYTITDGNSGQATATVRISGDIQRLFLPLLKTMGSSLYP
jgi:hypothetical protein